MEETIGPYRIADCIGEGGMAVVYKAQRYQSAPFVALKLMKENALSLPDLHARFLREARIMARLKHPHIIEFIDRGLHENRPYIVSEYADQGDLRAFLSERNLPLLSRLKIMYEVCCGLEAAHRLGIIHRDIKPGNILLSSQSGAKLSDFGIATAPWSDQTRLTQTRDTLGTLDYIAPEQRLNAKLIDFRCDHYAIGVILYELITGHRPMGFFRPPKQISPHIPDRLNQLVIICLNPEPGERYPNSTVLKDELLEIIQNYPPQAGPVAEVKCRDQAEIVPDTLPGIEPLLRTFSALPLQQRLIGKPKLLRQLGQLPTAAILGQMDRNEGMAKECLIESLSGRQDPAICPRLVELLHDPYYNEKAAQVLTGLKCPEAEDSLLDMLSGHSSYAHLAIRPLAGLHSARALVPISGFLHHKLAWIRSLAIEALAEIGLPKCRKLLEIQARKDPDPDNRAKAQQLLRRS